MATLTYLSKNFKTEKKILQERHQQLLLQKRKYIVRASGLTLHFLFLKIMKPSTRTVAMTPACATSSELRTKGSQRRPAPANPQPGLSLGHAAHLWTGGAGQGSVNVPRLGPGKAALLACSRVPQIKSARGGEFSNQILSKKKKKTGDYKKKKNPI